MKWLKVGVVLVGALVVTALGIDAADTLSGKGGTMLGQLVATDTGVCPVGMIEVPTALSFTCVDRYEAAAGENCPSQNPTSGSATQDNINVVDCGAVSAPNRTPWSFITREQAKIACARSGKRLPSSDEWYQAALGSVDSGEDCNIAGSGVSESGKHPSCRSAAGAEDMIGNAWEWVSDDVIDGSYNGRTLPGEGYVTQVDHNGVATVTDSSPSAEFAADYLWLNESGAFGVLRGGFYGSKSDAGVYAFHAKTAPSTAGTAIGFRCVR